jgi:hypothetical protein
MNSSIKSSSEDKLVATVPKNYYFIESEIAPLILQWQEIYKNQKECENLLKNEVDEDNPERWKELSVEEKVFVQQRLKSEIAIGKPQLEKIMNETCKIIKGVIFRAEFHKKEKYNICFQVAVEACIKALPRFNPEYGTAFNYLSLTAKKSIIYYLIKRAKKSHLSLDFEYIDDDNLQLKNVLRQEEKTLRNLEIENLTDSISNLIQDLNEHRGLNQVNKELREYLFYNQGKYDKKDFFKWSKSDGISSNLLRKFIKFLKEHRDTLYKEIGVY